MTSTALAYDAATRHTGQSEPIISRSGPNDSKATSRNGVICSGVQCCQSASVTNPDSFHNTFGDAASRDIPCAQESMLPLLIGGLALHNVADADEFRISSDDVQLRSDVRRAQVGPSDHAENPRRALGQLEQPAGFFQRLARLNRNRCVEVVAF